MTTALILAIIVPVALLLLVAALWALAAIAPGRLADRRALHRARDEHPGPDDAPERRYLGFR